MTIFLIIILGAVAVLLVRYLVSRSKTHPITKLTGGQTGLFLAFGGILLALVALSLAGRVHWLAPLLGGAVPLIVRLIPRLYRFLKAGTFGAGSSDQGRTSEVSSQWLRMTLDHDSGHMEGEVLLGEHAGKFLSELDENQLMALRSAMEDEDSLRLLDAWLDRNFEDWRGAAGPDGSGQTRSEAGRDAGGKMTREEALRVLGLAEGADEKQVRASYKQLMQKLHPDLGGSDYLASVVNRAKDVLLGE